MRRPSASGWRDCSYPCDGSSRMVYKKVRNYLKGGPTLPRNISFTLSLFYALLSGSEKNPDRVCDKHCLCECTMRCYRYQCSLWFVSGIYFNQITLDIAFLLSPPTPPPPCSYERYIQGLVTTPHSANMNVLKDTDGQQ